MGEMTERVARALCARHYSERFGRPIDHVHVKANVEGNWHTFEDEARAAIEAMRKPTLEMEISGDAEWDHAVPNSAEIFDAMISTALSQAKARKD